MKRKGALEEVIMSIARNIPCLLTRQQKENRSLLVKNWVGHANQICAPCVNCSMSKFLEDLKTSYIRYLNLNLVPAHIEKPPEDGVRC